MSHTLGARAEMFWKGGVINFSGRIMVANVVKLAKVGEMTKVARVAKGEESGQRTTHFASPGCKEG